MWSEMIILYRRIEGPIIGQVLLAAQSCMTLWTIACQAPLSMKSRQEYWSGFPLPFPGDLPDPGIKPGSPALQADSLLSEPPGKLHNRLTQFNFFFLMFRTLIRNVNMFLLFHSVTQKSEASSWKSMEVLKPFLVSL